MSTTSTKKPEQAELLEVAVSEKPEREQESKSSARYTSPRPFREWQPEQGQLLPQYTREVLGEEHMACFFVELRKALDFSPILKAYNQECGQPPYHPVMMALLHSTRPASDVLRDLAWRGGRRTLPGMSKQNEKPEWVRVADPSLST